MNANTNIDIKETEKFGSYAQSWWDPNGPLATLHAINPPRLEFIQRHVDLTNKDVLDIGCGAGILTESLYTKGGNVTGIDASAEVLKVATEHAKTNNLNIEYLHLSAEQYAPTHDKKFDVVTCMELIEHVPNPLQLLQSCAELLKPNGKFFISTINRTMQAYLFAIIGAEYVLNIIPKNTHEYRKFIKPVEMQQMLTTAGMHLEDLSGMSYQPFTKHAALCTNANINYLAYAIKE